MRLLPKGRGEAIIPTMKEPVKNIPRILIVCGPTACGKSDLAVKISKKIGGEIISADSRQVYKGLNLGTGKITKKEMGGVPHHLLDVADPKKQFTASDFVALARAKIQEIFERGHTPIICGGTGFYIASLLGEWSLPEVPPNKEFREKLSLLSTPKLFSMLQKLDPKRAETVDRQNPVRLIRAIEIAEALGKVPPLNIWTSDVHILRVLKIGLDFPDKKLKKRIALRLKKRLKQGMFAEARSLHARGLSWKRMEELGLEYRYLSRLLQNKISRKEFEEELLKETWAYVKRQRTWFRKDKKVKWFGLKEEKKIFKVVKDF